MATPPDFSAGAVLTAAQMNAIGMWRVASGTLSTATTDFQSVFTSDFTNYRIVIDQISMNATGDLYWRLLNGSTPATGADYAWALQGLTNAGGGADSSAGAQTLAYTGVTINVAVANLKVGSLIMDLLYPQIAERTIAMTTAYALTTNWTSRVGGSNHGLATAYNGIRFLTNTAVTATGNVTIYGYRKP